MTEENKTQQPAAPAGGKPPVGGRPNSGSGGRSRGSGNGGRGGRGVRNKTGDVPVESDYEEKNLEIARVTRVTKGGKRMRFRALTVIGNRKGRVGFGLAKGLDVALATSKATAQARKALITVPLIKDTIPHPVEAKFAAAHVLLKPAPQGTGIKAGGAVRAVLELAGVPNVVSKILGSGNKINNVKATFIALKKLQLRAKSGATAGQDKSEETPTPELKA
jgi:small subunit ribosomal protein S5